jgi:hypothetical protein
MILVVILLGITTSPDDLLNLLNFMFLFVVQHILTFDEVFDEREAKPTRHQICS